MSRALCIRNRFVWIKRKLLIVVGGIVALAGIGAIYQAVATTIDRRTYPPPGQLVDVGGYALHLYCTGANLDGRASIILEQGSGGTASAGS